MKFTLAFVMCLALTAQVTAQAIIINPDSAFCDPSIKDMPRSKGVELTYERRPEYSIRSDSKRDFIQDGSGELNHDRRFELKLKAPLLNRPFLKLALGFNYQVEEFRFSEPEKLTYPFYRTLEDKPLKKIGGTLYIIKPFRGNTYVLMRGAAYLNGDYRALNIPSSEFLKFSLTPLYGWKINGNTSLAAGVSFGHTFGERSLYPVVAFTRSFRKRWAWEATLPVSAKVRFSPDQQTHLYISGEISGGNYAIRLDDPIFTNFYPVVHLQHSELRLLFSIEREIYDFIWFGLETGTRTNLRYHLSDSDNIEPDILIESKLGQALVLNASLFLVVPKKYAK